MLNPSYNVRLLTVSDLTHSRDNMYGMMEPGGMPSGYAYVSVAKSTVTHVKITESYKQIVIFRAVYNFFT